MTRIVRAWTAMSGERRLAAVAALALLVTMFFPWYGLQSLNRKTGAIYSHDINAFGDVSFVEAAIFLVAAGVVAMLIARAEERQFSLPGGDGTIVAAAGGWATLLIFYRVFDRPSGHGYPVGIEWGFFLAFVAAGSLGYAGWRMRHGERPAPPARRRAARSPEPPSGPSERSYEEPAEHRPAAASRRRAEPETGETALIPVAASRREGASNEPVPAPPAPARAGEPRRARFPPRPGEQPEQLSFEDPPAGE